VAGITVAALLAIAGYSYGATQQRIDRNEDKIGVLRDMVTALSDVISSHRAQLVTLEGRLSRIEDKQDKILERVSR
jgi:hypothetical protein